MDEFDQQMDYSENQPQGFDFTHEDDNHDEHLGGDFGDYGNPEQDDYQYEQEQDQGQDGGFGFAFDDQQQPEQQFETTNDDTNYFLGGGDDLGMEQASAAAPAVPLQAPESNGETAKDRWDKQKAIELQALAKRHSEEKEKAIAAGQRELELFYKERQVTIERTKASNRNEEKQDKADLANTLSNGTEWQKVSKYCDLKERHDPKQAQQAAKTERMRTLLVDLRNEKR